MSDLSSSGSDDESSESITRKHTRGKNEELKFLNPSDEENQSDDDSWATGKEGEMYVLRDTVAVKWDEKAQILRVLCLWKGSASDDPSKSTYQELEE
eukprot:scaffold55710_cov38-Cyclotella_meneghiniana.AAC.1